MVSSSFRGFPLSNPQFSFRKIRPLRHQNVGFISSVSGEFGPHGTSVSCRDELAHFWSLHLREICQLPNKNIPFQSVCDVRESWHINGVFGREKLIQKPFLSKYFVCMCSRRSVSLLFENDGWTKSKVSSCHSSDGQGFFFNNLNRFSPKCPFHSTFLSSQAISERFFPPQYKKM